MTAIIVLALIFLMAVFQACSSPQISFRRGINFNADWKFMRIDSLKPVDDSEFMAAQLRDIGWESVQLPHTPRIEPLVVNDQWQGVCWYRKHFSVNSGLKGKAIFIEFEGAMHIADVWLNGEHLFLHEGGYLPFTIELSQKILFGGENVLAVRLDNRDNPDVPPGKPLKQLDFCWYGGLYRNVKMHILDPVHITDPVSAQNGGIFIRYDNVSQDKADILLQTQLANTGHESKTLRLNSEIHDRSGVIITEVLSDPITLQPESRQTIRQTITISKPRLWHPDHPDLYLLKSQVLDQGELTDEVMTKFGIRSISFSAKGGFRINGEPFYLRGTNRHQEYPYVGYAVSDSAQYRDAFKIKQAGFDYIRLSHYPQSPAFMEACDELGIVLMDAIPAWQFMGNNKFRELCFRNCTEMIRRDRNHPSVILWEVSLNETWMDSTFLRKTDSIAHAEYPGDQCFTCGWVDKEYDLYLQARQHGGCKSYVNGDKACIISEYGDWEYYAQNAGLDQPGFKNLKPDERNSRQLRAFGEKRLLQQAMNFQEAHNDNRSTVAAGDGLWVMYDYNRGYADDLEASGTMDIFRLPKWSYYFYQSQRNAARHPFLRIATHWSEDSPTDVRIFSNCEEVALYLNDQLIGRQKPDRNAFTGNLIHPPFTFCLGTFAPGSLTAIGYQNNNEIIRQKLETPSEPSRIGIEFDLSGRNLVEDGSDLIFVYASIVDEKHSLIPDFSEPVTFNLNGPGMLIGKNPVHAEAGIATIILKASLVAGTLDISAESSIGSRRLSGEGRHQSRKIPDQPYEELTEISAD